MVKTENMIKIVVDGYCLGNPGKGGYQGVDLSNNSKIFIKHIEGKTTNNISEYLAVVHAIAEMFKRNESNFVIYTDSQTAIAWVGRKKANSSLPLNMKTAESWTLLNRANDYLQSKADYSKFKVLFWNKREKGENPADFGNK